MNVDELWLDMFFFIGELDYVSPGGKLANRYHCLNDVIGVTHV